MTIFILLILLFIIFYYMFTNKVKIKIPTFFKKGFKVSKGSYGIFCYCGFQGNGKTYSCAEYVYDNKENIILFSNVKLNNVDYIYYNGFKEMLELRDAIDYSKFNNLDYIIFKKIKYMIDWDKQIVFIYDEIFSELQRGSKIDTNVLDFITQMRKRQFILLTTSQIWNDIPITWRRLTRFQIDCSMRNFLGINVLIKVFHDAELMKWDNDSQEFLAPIISTTITHTRKVIANSYDTHELIHNRLSSFSSSEYLDNVSEEEKGEIIPSGDIKKGEIDKDFWGEEETQQTLTGLRI